MSKILLGSQSPGRKHVLEKYGILYDSYAPNVDEKSHTGNISFQEAVDLVSFNSKLKMDTLKSSIANFNDYNFILTSDTTVFCKNKIYEKTYDKELAKKLLYELAGTEHQVITAVCLVIPSIDSKIISFYESTEIKITSNQNLLNYYLLSDDCLGKAGCYGIQGPGTLIIDQVLGNIDTVIGLPMSRILENIPSSFLKNLKSIS